MKLKEKDQDVSVEFSAGSIDSATPAEWDAVTYNYSNTMDISLGDISLSTVSIDTPVTFAKPKYKFREDELIDEFKRYIDATYTGHYSKNKFQSTEVIIERGHGTGFCMGNIDKYSNRYGNKGTREDARKDLMKVLHYALIQLFIHDMETKKLEA